MKIYLGFILLVLASCHENDSKKIIVRTYFSETKNVHISFTEINGKKEGQEFVYYPDGNIRTITTYRGGKKQGWQYWFFNSGTLDGDRLWIDNKKNGYCNDYYDTTGNTKTSLLYENDHLLYRETFDTNGVVINIEK